MSQSNATEVGQELERALLESSKVIATANAYRSKGDAVSPAQAAELAKELERVIEQTTRTLGEAKSFRESMGLGGDDAQALLEAQMSPADIEAVNSQVQAEIERMERDAKLSTGVGSSPRPIGRRAQMI